MKILLSIKPEYTKQIFEGNKIYEYRKILFKNKNIKSVVVYATLPIGKIIGEFKIEKILRDTPDKIWKETQSFSGMSKEKYEKYFQNKKEAIAIKIKSPKLYKIPKTINEFDSRIKQAPQSFIYLK